MHELIFWKTLKVLYEFLFFKPCLVYHGTQKIKSLVLKVVCTFTSDAEDSLKATYFNSTLYEQQDGMQHVFNLLLVIAQDCFTFLAIYNHKTVQINC